MAFARAFVFLALAVAAVANPVPESFAQSQQSGDVTFNAAADEALVALMSSEEPLSIAETPADTEAPIWDFSTRRNATAPPPTPPSPGSSTIQQTVTFNFGSTTAAQYNANAALKLAVEQGYGAHIGIYTPSTNTWASGTSLTSSGSRRAVDVLFNAQVSAALASSAQTAANALSGSSSSSQLSALTSLVQTQITSAGVTGVTATATGAASPTIVTTSGAAKATLGLAAVATVVLSFFM